MAVAPAPPCGRRGLTLIAGARRHVWASLRPGGLPALLPAHLVSQRRAAPRTPQRSARIAAAVGFSSRRAATAGPRRRRALRALPGAQALERCYLGPPPKARTAARASGRGQTAVDAGAVRSPSTRTARSPGQGPLAAGCLGLGVHRAGVPRPGAGPRRRGSGSAGVTIAPRQEPRAVRSQYESLYFFCVAVRRGRPPGPYGERAGHSWFCASFRAPLPAPTPHATPPTHTFLDSPFHGLCSGPGLAPRRRLWAAFSGENKTRQNDNTPKRTTSDVIVHFREACTSA